MNLTRFTALLVVSWLTWANVYGADAPPAAVERRREILSTLPVELRMKLKKFGEWDYKQFDGIYRDFTAFNFGATGSAAGLSKEQLYGLARIASPTPNDISYMGSLDLVASFNEKRTGLFVLLEMLKTDSHLSRISYEFTSVVEVSSWEKGKAHLDKSRLDDYRKRFDSLALHEGVLRTKDYSDTVFFIVRAEGLCVAGASCGYAYSSVDLPRVEADPVSALGEFAKENPKSRGTMFFQKLEDHWYTFYEVDWQ